MIVVLADDLSGAAELAGIAVRHGLTAEVQTIFSPDTNAEVVCVDTNTRLLPAEQAAQIVTDVTHLIIAARPRWIFKKCDSVLRGPVLAEARAMARVAGKTRCVIMTANPSRDRIIRSGQYLIGGHFLHETLFAQDPAHPCKSSLVTELLGGVLIDVETPDAVTASDVAALAATLNESALPVGAADFFEALLQHRVPARAVPVEPVTLPIGPTLHVCGSAAVWAQRRTEATAHSRPVFALPHDVAAIIHALENSGPVLIGIGDGPTTHGHTSAQLLAALATTVSAILRQQPVTRLLLEGGATAAGVMHAAGWTRLSALPSPATGVGVLTPVGRTGPLLCIKPGSYPWPAGLLL